MRLISINFQSSFVLPTNKPIIFIYDGFCFKLGNGRNRYSDYIQCIVKSDSEKDLAFRKMLEYISCISYANNAPLFSLGFGDMPFNSSDIKKSRRLYIENRTLIQLPYRTLDLKCIPLISNSKQKIALSIFREAKNSCSPFYKFLCYWNIIDLALPAAIRNKSLLLYRNEYMPDKKDQAYYGADTNKLSELLWSNYRCAIAHVTRKPKISDNPEDIFSLNKILHLLEKFMAVLIKKELNITDNKCLVTMPEIKYPEYVTIRDKLIRKNKMSGQLLNNYLNNAYDPNRSFSDIRFDAK